MVWSVFGSWPCRGRAGRGYTRVLWLATAALAAVAWAARGWLLAAHTTSARAELHSRLEFPRCSPHSLAHLLADFNTLPEAQRAIPGSWVVEAERGNLTAQTWSYHVSFSCGARCAGEASVDARAAAVRLRVRLCTHHSPSPLHSPECDEVDISASVSGLETAPGGSVLTEHARAECAAPGETAASCRTALSRHRSEHWARLRLPFS